jgi:tRNA A-37 threonylcarbamoyl transferase component Bud32
MYAGGRSEAAFARAEEQTLASGPLRPVGWAPELETVFWTFPNDRKLRLEALAELVGSDVRAVQLVAYAPEKCATLRLDGGRRALAYAKVYAEGGAERPRALYRRLAGAPVRVPAVLASRQDTILLEPLPGRPLATLTGARLVEGHRLLGHALAALHRLTPPEGLRFRRLESGRMPAAAELIARACPEAAGEAHALADRLECAGDGGPDAWLHGDLHPKNVLVDGDRVGLVDLDQGGAGPAAADLGSVLAGLRYSRVVDNLDARRADELARAFLAGYAAERPLPAEDDLRRYTAAALLAERALRAVNRIRPAGLARLRPLLTDATELLDG